MKKKTTSSGPDCPIGVPFDGNGLKIKKEKVSVPKVELVSYSIKAVIPTGSYANIQPEIIVLADSLAEADKFVMPYIRKLYEEYAPSLLPQVTYTPSTGNGYPGFNGVRGVDTPVTSAPYVGPAVVVTTAEALPHKPVTTVTGATTAFLKAEQAIGSCLSAEALQLIESQISKSVKLNHDEKFSLLKLVEIKATELDK